MTTPFSYSTYFVLDKPHFNECFSNSVDIDKSWNAYKKSIFFCVIGVVLLFFIQVNGYVAYFMVVLGIVEALSVYYQQPWWVTRQMLSRSSNSKVTLTIDEQGIHTESFYQNSVIAWQDISEIKPTKDGLILLHNKGKSYISGSCLSEEAKSFLSSKVQ